MSKTSKLLLGFKPQSSVAGLARDDLQKIATRLGLTETAVVHLALARLYMDVFPEEIEYSLPSKDELQAMEANRPAGLTTKASLRSVLLGARR